MTDAELMENIHLSLGDYIAGAVEGTSFPPAVIAALVANESGGVANASRFEPAVMGQLAKVIAQQRPAYGPAGCKKAIGFFDLDTWCEGRPPAPFSAAVMRLINLATSWGPTQIMGWHAIEFGFDLSDLTNLATHFERTVQLLEWFQQRYTLEIPLATNTSPCKYTAADEIWAPFCHCWNTGSPVAPTFDPEYVSKGLNRMHLYATNLADAQK